MGLKISRVVAGSGKRAGLNLDDIIKVNHPDYRSEHSGISSNDFFAFTEVFMLTYADLEQALKHVPLEQIPKVYEFILAHAEWPFENSPAEMKADDAIWEEKFASEESQNFFANTVQEVRAEFAEDKTQPLEDLLEDAPSE